MQLLSGRAPGPLVCPLRSLVQAFKPRFKPKCLASRRNAVWQRGICQRHLLSAGPHMPSESALPLQRRLRFQRWLLHTRRVVGPLLRQRNSVAGC